MGTMRPSTAKPSTHRQKNFFQSIAAIIPLAGPGLDPETPDSAKRLHFAPVTRRFCPARNKAHPILGDSEGPGESAGFQPGETRPQNNGLQPRRTPAPKNESIESAPPPFCRAPLQPCRRRDCAAEASLLPPSRGPLAAQRPATDRSRGPCSYPRGISARQRLSRDVALGRTRGNDVRYSKGN
jgi:hypothetical protein